MAEFDDTDELPTVSEVFPVPRDEPAEADADADADATTTPLPAPTQPPDRSRGANDLVAPPTAGPEPDEEQPDDRVARPARFAGARRRSLLWDAGWCLVSGVVLLVAASAGRAIEVGPAWATAVIGGITVGWAVVLAALAAGGVSRPTTALVGLVNLALGTGGFALAWTRPDVPVLLLVVAAQVAGFGVVQLVASVRR